MPSVQPQQAVAHPFPWRRLIPLAVLVIAVAAVFAFGLHRQLSFDSLRDNRAWLLAQVEARPVLSVLALIGIYIAVAALSVPGGAVLTVTAGFLVGQIWGTACAVVGATIGATILFLIAKTALGDSLRRRAGPWLKRLEAGFAENAFSYLLVLRLIPIFPFFIVNLVPAFLGVSLRTFVAATFLGIIPGTFVFATVGAGLGSVFDSGQSFSAGAIFTPQIVTALVGLALLALLPVAYRKLARRRV